MKKRQYISLCLLLLLFVGCIHKYPDICGVQRTKVTVDVTLDLELLPLETPQEFITRADADGECCRRRFIVEAYSEGKSVARRVTVPEEEYTGGTFKLPLCLQLPAGDYTLVVWTDYVKDSTDADFYYNTADMEHIICSDPYTGCTPYRDCLYGSAPLLLTDGADMPAVHVKVDMVRPLAKYRIIATDVQEFLDETAHRPATGETYTVTIAYNFYLPLDFNILTGKPGRSEMGVAFTAPLIVTDEGGGECTLASDFIFVNGTESYIPLSIEIRDSRGEVVSRVAGIEVPYRRAHLTTLRGRLLTNGISSGIGIDPGFDEDINIDLDKLP